MMLQNIKVAGLGFEPDDTTPDARLKWIIQNTTLRLKTLLGGMEPPEELNYIIEEVSIIRFNRIGSEGLTTQSVEGQSLAFRDDDFDGFKTEIQAFLDTQKQTKRGKVVFL